ncbi:hypothetical protein EJB05_53513 [Eragrostis curvula]|uniref:Uncharacterized protein n=1 Tax=Eragrostis curvula TaxID=38414 RepID=A0A5J9SPR9_9POAL|nr:hypothetical protein EJB05_53513 [Eragrostis curvula]
MVVEVLFMSTPKEAAQTAILNKTKTPRRFFPVQTNIKKVKDVKILYERRVLRDVNPERKQPFAYNNSMAVLKDGNRGVMNITVKHNIAEYWIASPYWILKANKRCILSWLCTSCKLNGSCYLSFRSTTRCLS